MSASILNSVKKVLGLSADDESFDDDILMYVNTVLVNLHQLGIGPESPLQIEGADETWDEFTLGDDRYNSAQTYTSLRVRLLFDPPTNSYLVDALKEQIRELEYRLSYSREEVAWTAPTS